MKTYNSTNIRNIAVAGHAGRGKTTLCEAMLYTAGATKRLGKVADGTTVMDYDPEEKKRQASNQSDRYSRSFRFRGRTFRSGTCRGLHAHRYGRRTHHL